MKASLLSGDDDIDRATLWLEGRKNKDGEFEGDELKEKAEKIVSQDMCIYFNFITNMCSSHKTFCNYSLAL